MIIKDLIELCPVEEIVSEIMLMCGVDESEREEISRNHTAFINNLKKVADITRPQTGEIQKHPDGKIPFRQLCGSVFQNVT